MINKFALTVVLGSLATSSLAADVYKYIDDNGNIYYSDKKPLSNITEDKLKKITINDNKHLNPKSDWQSTDPKLSKKDLEFEKFFIASPGNNSSITLEGDNILVIANLAKDLSSKYRVKFYLNGIARGKVKSGTQLISDMEEGNHSLYAEVINAKTRKVLKTSPEINFNIKIKNK